MVMNIKGAGNKCMEGNYTDLVIKLIIDDDKYYKDCEGNLIRVEKIDVNWALCGECFTINHFDQTLTVNENRLMIEPLTTFVYEGLGMKENTNLTIMFDIVFSWIKMVDQIIQTD